MHRGLPEDILVHRPPPEVQMKSFVPHKQERAFWDAHNGPVHRDLWAEQERNVSDDTRKVGEIEPVGQFRLDEHEIKSMVEISCRGCPAIFEQWSKLKIRYFLSIGVVGTGPCQQILGEGYKSPLD